MEADAIPCITVMLCTLIGVALLVTATFSFGKANLFKDNPTEKAKP